MKKLFKSIQDALLSTSTMGSMDGRGPDFDSIRTEAIHDTAAALKAQMSQETTHETLMRLAENHLKQSWPGVYGGKQGRESLDHDLQLVIEEALPGPPKRPRL